MAGRQAVLDSIVIGLMIGHFDLDSDGTLTVCDQYVTRYFFETCKNELEFRVRDSLR